ncbi:nucleotide sugar dehydrogenase [Alteriqipengyuania sp. WL0013]|uniref:nucleotide sugar dehydrogenase n=1 Tax=Alteriqipengyuania sp. WL0013 TaxID=3110773 RepID=UPI002C2525DF|nr:nucleotide sugar dehydrogenase [Alteriqipengyuania sp. WL0013]MEB3415621.1 nucleotide sugar dehydrogenase [Alteriqipengyuania sp. WL0013]
MSERIAVLGLGYVGLPVAVALAEKFGKVTGFDVSERRVQSLQSGTDWTGEIEDDRLVAAGLELSSDPDCLRDATFLIVTVPTPIDAERRPDLGPIASACRLIGPRLSEGSVVVFESTVYPGVTDEVCGPLLAKESGLVRGRDFFLGYSPERINPGDKVHRLETITKIVAGEDEATLDRIVAVYSEVIEAGLHKAPTIKVAEAAKVIENTQRDLNIALMNEISLIFDRMGIRTTDVLAAAQTKWNFLPFTPGLVGGHCIGVDPYYLTSAAERHGYHPDVILAGRRINDEMGAYVARKAIKLLIQQGKSVNGARIGLLGLTFKENVPDLRNSKVPDIVAELREYGVEVLIHDPHVDPEEARHEYGLELVGINEIRGVDALILAVNHAEFLTDGVDLPSRLDGKGVLLDVKSALEPQEHWPDDLVYWSL